MEKTLTVRPAAFEEVRHLLAMADDFDTSGGLEPIEETCANSSCFAVEDDSGIVGAYALDIVSHWGGAEGVIVAAGGVLAGGNLAMSVLPDALARLGGCASVRVHTVRAGLAKLLAKQGFEFRGFILGMQLP